MSDTAKLCAYPLRSIHARGAGLCGLPEDAGAHDIGMHDCNTNTCHEFVEPSAQPSEPEPMMDGVTESEIDEILQTERKPERDPLLLTPTVREHLISAVEIARILHENYERLAPSFNYETRKETRVPFDELPDDSRDLMICASSYVMGEIDRRHDAERRDPLLLAALDRLVEFIAEPTPGSQERYEAAHQSLVEQIDRVAAEKREEKRAASGQPENFCESCGHEHAAGIERACLVIHCNCQRRLRPPIDIEAEAERIYVAWRDAGDGVHLREVIADELRRILKEGK